MQNLALLADFQAKLFQSIEGEGEEEEEEEQEEDNENENEERDDTGW